MLDGAYWNGVVDKLTDKSRASWAAHVLSSNIEMLDEILSLLDKKTLIRNCLLCYSIDFAAQPYLDEVLSQFDAQELIDTYKKLDKKPIQTAGALMWLLEDMDPEFKWAH